MSYTSMSHLYTSVTASTLGIILIAILVKNHTYNQNSYTSIKMVCKPGLRYNKSKLIPEALVPDQIWATSQENSYLFSTIQYCISQD